MEMGNANHFITLKQINRECLVSYSKRPQKVLRWTFQASSVVFRVKMKHLTGLLLLGPSFRIKLRGVMQHPDTCHHHLSFLI